MMSSGKRKETSRRVLVATVMFKETNFPTDAPCRETEQQLMTRTREETSLLELFFQPSLAL